MRIPLILQSDRSECAVACLAMVAAFHGNTASLRDYRARFRTSHRGTTLASLRDYAEQLGFKCRGVRAELDELAQLRRPAILHWELDHFVVLQSVGRRWVTVVDPAVGLRRLRTVEVSDRFTGVALELSPTLGFVRRKETASVGLLDFIPAFRGLGGALAAACVLTVTLQAFALAMPLNMQLAVDHGVRQGDWGIVTALALGFGFVGLISATTAWLRDLLVQYVGSSSTFRIVTGLAHHLFRLPDSWFTARHTGDVVSRFASTAPIGQFLMTGAFGLLVDAVMVVGAFAILLLYSWDLTAVLCTFLAAFALLRFGTVGHVRNLTHEAIGAGAREDSSFIENVERHRAIKLLGAEALREDAWGEQYVESINADLRLARFGAHVGFAGGAIGAVQSVVVLLLGAGKVIDGMFTLGMLFAFSSYGGLFSMRVHAVIESVVTFRMLRLHRERIADIVLEPRETPAEERGFRRSLQGRIDVQSLRFAYGDDAPAVIEAFDLAIKPGEFVAIEGPSGAGKSTFIKLLGKLLVPSGGTIRIDGVDLRELDTRHYRSQIGVVMQDDDLFSGTLLENITLVESAVDRARAEEAARAACIHDDIIGMPMDYLTLVGPMGSTLSGGQRQRLMIARMLYRRPRLVLLDEGTAHLNDELQQKVLDRVLALGVTVIAASHDERVLVRAHRRVRFPHFAGRSAGGEPGNDEIGAGVLE